MIVSALSINFKGAINRSFAFLAFLIFLSQLQHYIYWSPYGLYAPDFFVRFFPNFDFLIGFAALNFSYRFVKKKNDTIFYLSLILPILTSVLMFKTDLVQKGYQTFEWGISGHWGPLFPVALTINLLLPTLYCFYIFYKEYHARPSKIIRLQLKMILIGGFIALIGGYISSLIKGYFQYNLQAPDFSNEAELIFLIFVFIGIIKYKFLNLNLETVSQDLFSHIKDGVLLVDQQKQVIHYNGSAKKLLDTGSDLISKNLDALFDQIDFSITFQDKEMTIGNRYIMLSNFIIYESNEAQGAIVFLRDITARKKAELERLELQKQLFHSGQLSSIGTLASSVAHELNNPLTATLGFVRQLKKIHDQDVQTTDKLEKIERASNRMSKIIFQLRKISRNSAEDAKKSLRLSAIIEEASLLLAKQLETKNINFIIEITPPDLEIFCNEIQMESVFQNLITNSKDAFESNPENSNRFIKITAARINEQVEIIYQDNAGGFNLQIAESIFIPFFTTKAIGKGTGLGMSIVKDAIGSHGGSIDLINYQGGVTFQISLPIVINHESDTVP